MKSDFTGGIIMFGIMFGIALLQLYVFKKMKVFASTRTDITLQSPKFMCQAGGGEWTGDRNPEDPCCYQPSINLPPTVPICQGARPDIPFP